eukprot:s3189_g13.t2
MSSWGGAANTSVSSLGEVANGTELSGSNILLTDNTSSTISVAANDVQSASTTSSFPPPSASTSSTRTVTSPSTASTTSALPLVVNGHASDIGGFASHGSDRLPLPPGYVRTPTARPSEHIENKDFVVAALTVGFVLLLLFVLFKLWRRRAARELAPGDMQLSSLSEWMGADEDDDVVIAATSSKATQDMLQSKGVNNQMSPASVFKCCPLASKQLSAAEVM